MKPQSVRSQRKFEESMATWLQNIDNSIYAAETLCKPGRGSICKHKDRECAFKSKMFPTGSLYICKLHSLRVLIGDHTPQHDIEIPSDNTQSEQKGLRK